MSISRDSFAAPGVARGQITLTRTQIVNPATAVFAIRAAPKRVVDPAIVVRKLSYNMKSS